MSPETRDWASWGTHCVVHGSAMAVVPALGSGAQIPPAMASHCLHSVWTSLKPLGDAPNARENMVLGAGAPARLLLLLFAAFQVRSRARDHALNATT